MVLKHMSQRSNVATLLQNPNHLKGVGKMRPTVSMLAEDQRGQLKPAAPAKVWRMGYKSKPLRLRTQW